MLVSSFELLRQSLRLYRANFWTLVGYSAWLLFPVALYFGLSFLPQQDPFVIAATIACSVLDLIVAIWISIMLIKIIYQIEEKIPTDLPALQKESVLLFQPIILVAFLQFLFILGGFILLIIPGIIASVWYAFSQLSVVIDGKRGRDALRFSRSLTKDRFFSVLSRLLVGPVIIGMIYAVLLTVIFILIGIIIGFDPTTTFTSDQIPAWVNLLESTFEIFLIPLVTVYIVMLYRELKKGTEKAERAEMG